MFKPLYRKTNKEGLSVKYRYKDYTFWWRNYCQLSITDQSVFIAIHRLASEKGKVSRVSHKENETTLTAVRAALNLKLDATTKDVLVLDTTVYELANTIGLSKSGQNYKLISESLLKLSGVSFVIYRGDDVTTKFWQANLISEMGGIDDRLYIALNPTLSKAIAENQATYISMEEQRMLKGDVAKRLHMWFSGWLGAGQINKIHIDQLITHVWGDEVTGDAHRRRRVLLRKAIPIIKQLDGWICSEDKNTNIIIVKRSKFKCTEVI